MTQTNGLTPDDERTLQVLEFADDGHSGWIGFVTIAWMRCEGLIDLNGVLTDAGRAKLAELREKKGRGE